MILRTKGSGATVVFFPSLFLLEDMRSFMKVSSQLAARRIVYLHLHMSKLTGMGLFLHICL